MTREEAKEVFLNRGFIDGIYDGNKWREACIVISKWLEQEPILDKIRAEIEKLQPNLRPEQMTDYDYAMVDVVNDIVAIIDKYKAESEGYETIYSNTRN